MSVVCITTTIVYMYLQYLYVYIKMHIHILCYYYYVISLEFFRQRPQRIVLKVSLLHFLMHIHVLMLCRNFELISIKIGFFMNF